jgi:hypothetical protein
MAVFEHFEGGFAPAFITSLTRALGGLGVVTLIVCPLLIGALFGHIVTERLEDPEASAIKANLPQQDSRILVRAPGTTNG